MANHVAEFEEPRRVGLYIKDLSLLILSFIFIYLVKMGDLTFDNHYLAIFPVFLGCWLLSNLLTNKFRNTRRERRHLLKMEPFISGALLLGGMLSMALYGFKMFNISRFVVFGSVGLYLVLEVLLLSGCFFPLKKRGQMLKIFSPGFLLVDFFLLSAGFFTIYYLKRGTLKLDDDFMVILFVIYFIWIFTSLFVHRFRLPSAERNYLKAIYPFTRSLFIIFSIVAFFIFGFRLREFSRIIVLGSLGIFASLELMTVTFLFFKRRNPNNKSLPQRVAPEVLMADEVIQKERDECKRFSYEHHFNSRFIREKLMNIYLKDRPREFQFVDRGVDLSSVDILKAEVLDTGNPYNVHVLPDSSLEFLMNLHPLNTYRRLNRYLLSVHDKLLDDGLFISKFEPCERRLIHFRAVYPYALANILYLVDFCWRRVCPKLPFFKKVYFSVTRGRKRVLSLAEGLGRLYYCGFELVSLEAVDHYVYFIARKSRPPAEDPNPSYGMLFKMCRVGKGGKPIYIYKLRTMHPYSEYLQRYTVEKFGYGEKGKIDRDFRVTSWGRVMRRLWLDELPQLLNWLKRDLALVGVRPLSEKFLENYPPELKRERFKYKPGCIPPYVAYRMQKVEDYIESERIYLEAKKKHPVFTDVSVFFLAVYNILTNKIRSE
jgi:lipopolysaccharide/colanic/teichoic acid biosynthesis glycosyltransferase